MDAALAADGSPWRREGERLVLDASFGSFREAIEFVDAVADVAETLDHHPDIDVRYDRVRLVCFSHVTGGLTASDLALARAVQALRP